MSQRQSLVWRAEPHTIAKIEILKGYLHAWFRILGKARTRETILYVDGFAGPGHYTNHNEGSPLAALKAAVGAIRSLGTEFSASRLHCAFIEENRGRFEELDRTIAPFRNRPTLQISVDHCDFATGVSRLREAVPEAFTGRSAILVFVDPFGATDTPLEVIASCVQSESAELLINLDSDGVSRIFSAVSNNRREEQLTALFGSDCWRHALTEKHDQKWLCVQVLDLYKQQLLGLGMKFVWSFAMRGSKDALNYHLVFATKKKLGLVKMKEAMKRIDATGTYSFSDAHVDQIVLFRSDNEEAFAKKLLQAFDGQTVSMELLELFALTETPFVNAKAMLRVLQKQQRISVEPLPGENLRAGNFPEEKVKSVSFGDFRVKVPQGELFGEHEK